MGRKSAANDETQSSADNKQASAAAPITPSAQGNSDQVLLQPSVPPASGAAGTPADPNLPADCEVGKFCAPTSPDPENCGTLTLQQDVEVKRTPGNLLLVFDQSASMAEPWGATGQNKLSAAQMAIANAITSLQDVVTVGAIFFPTYACVPVFPPPPGGAVANIDGEGQIPFKPGPEFIAAWNDHWATGSIGFGIGTPMQEAFDRADSAITSAQLTGAIAVVAITDGAPTCFPEGADPAWMTDLEVNRARSWFTNNSVKTYVVGLPGAAGVQILNDVAQSGGTTEYILPDDPALLEAKLREVVAETVKTKFDSCLINLTPAADPADKLQMVVVEAGSTEQKQVPRMLSPTASWSVAVDGTSAELHGDLCSDAMGGRFSSITFEYGCKELPPLKPGISPM
jgi:Mg-chelatase subunit ChlD